ncbi:hypothetical protein PHYPSEUDO_004912 [Phytophthora pseudosyringae]|uniref:Uncharacterized protein n=1 Tax=Phytophthora pseudosyringae TaxID=221518 RepID=A0A8T1WCH4_9STRA|nr:hypothetical protein PHYPSEUDO_004912 [Phytophthora pseudosyringae]
MLDIKAIGSDLTPKEKDETMTDLAFFLDAFGSTRAVRIKLQEQEKGIKRLGNKVRQLLRQQDKRFPQEEEKNHPPTTRSSNHKTAEDVDETMETWISS